MNTIDAGAPASSVDPLPAVTPTASFTVSWSGEDDPGGSGVASFDVFVSIDGGPFEPWLPDATEMSATYDGAFGHTYAFYSLATDNVGHREDAPPVADTATTTGQGPGVCGDQNGDGMVNIFDVIIDLQIIVGLVGPSEEQTLLSDVVQDGKIDIFDVILTLQHIVGLTEIKVCGPPI